MSKITWKDIRACDVEYFQILDDDYEQEHGFLWKDAVRLLVDWLVSQPGDYTTNRKVMKQRIPPELYILVLETFIDDGDQHVIRPTRKALRMS